MQRLWRINRVLLQKLQDTHYIVTAADWAAVATLANFEAAYGTQEQLERVFKPKPLTTAASKTPNGLLLFFAQAPADKKHVGVDEVRRLIVKLENCEIGHALFITSGSLSSKAAEILATAQTPPTRRVIVYNDEELLYNVTKHRRVPKHELLSVTEAAEWLAQTGLKRNQLPRILEDDPQAKYLGASQGDLIRVTGSSYVTGQAVRHLHVASITR